MNLHDLPFIGMALIWLFAFFCLFKDHFKPPNDPPPSAGATSGELPTAQPA